MRILTVEDDLIQAMLLEHFIENAGHQYLGNAVNATEGTALITKTNPDVILSDIKIEGLIDGIQMIENLPSQFHKPVVFITGNSNPVYVERAKKIAGSRFLVKPLLYNTFARVLQEIESEVKK